MKKLLLSIIVLSSVTLGFGQGYLDSLKSIAIIDQKVMMPMRDGIRLSTDIYRPKSDEPVPIVFSRTPYNFNSWGDGEMRTRTFQRAYQWVKAGYAYVVQNERGRFFSEGEWDILGVPLTDGYDAFEWMKNQTWSNGKIGTYGCSSTAEWQMAVAALDHPAHAAMIPQGFGAGVGRVGDYYEQGNWYRGGAEQLLFHTWLYYTQHDEMKPQLPENITQEDLIRIQRFYDMAPEYPRVDWKEALWTLPLQDMIKAQNGPKGVFEKMVRRKPNDKGWYEGGLYHDNMEIKVPGFWFVSWYDVSVGPNIALFNHLRNQEDKEAANNQYLLIAPTLHCAYTRATENTIVGERNMGDARLDYFAMYTAWFDYWLKGEENGVLEKMPRIMYYTMGDNKWQTSDVWPPKEAKMTSFYLDSDGNANTLNGDGRLTLSPPKKAAKDTYTYDPANPVMSNGGAICCIGNATEGGSFDQRETEQREDVLVYTSAPLTEDIEVTGFIETSIYLSSDVKDTDVTVKLVDVYPDGTAYNIDETIQRVRYREGYDKEVFMEEGNVYKVDLSKMATSNAFKKGHRIRIEISSSDFPQYSRNLNTGGNNYDETEWKVAKNAIHHSKEYPSMISLPVIGKLKIEKR